MQPYQQWHTLPREPLVAKKKDPLEGSKLDEFLDPKSTAPLYRQIKSLSTSFNVSNEVQNWMSTLLSIFDIVAIKLLRASRFKLWDRDHIVRSEYEREYGTYPSPSKMSGLVVAARLLSYREFLSEFRVAGNDYSNSAGKVLFEYVPKEDNKDEWGTTRGGDRNYWKHNFLGEEESRAHRPITGENADKDPMRRWGIYVDERGPRSGLVQRDGPFRRVMACCGRPVGETDGCWMSLVEGQPFGVPLLYKVFTHNFWPSLIQWNMKPSFTDFRESYQVGTAYKDINRFLVLHTKIQNVLSDASEIMEESVKKLAEKLNRAKDEQEPLLSPTSDETIIALPDCDVLVTLAKLVFEYNSPHGAVVPFNIKAWIDENFFKVKEMSTNRKVLFPLGVNNYEKFFEQLDRLDQTIDTDSIFPFLTAAQRDNIISVMNPFFQFVEQPEIEEQIRKIENILVHANKENIEQNFLFKLKEQYTLFMDETNTMIRYINKVLLQEKESSNNNFHMPKNFIRESNEILTKIESSKNDLTKKSVKARSEKAQDQKEKKNLLRDLLVSPSKMPSRRKTGRNKLIGVPVLKKMFAVFLHFLHYKQFIGVLPIAQDTLKNLFQRTFDFAQHQESVVKMFHEIEQSKNFDRAFRNTYTSSDGVIELYENVVFAAPEIDTKANEKLIFTLKDKKKFVDMRQVLLVYLWELYIYAMLSDASEREQEDNVSSKESAEDFISQLVAIIDTNLSSFQFTTKTILQSAVLQAVFELMEKSFPKSWTEFLTNFKTLLKKESPSMMLAEIEICNFFLNNEGSVDDELVDCVLVAPIKQSIQARLERGHDPTPYEYMSLVGDNARVPIPALENKQRVHDLHVKYYHALANVAACLDETPEDEDLSVEKRRELVDALVSQWPVEYYKEHGYE